MIVIDFSLFFMIFHDLSRQEIDIGWYPPWSKINQFDLCWSQNRSHRPQITIHRWGVKHKESEQRMLRFLVCRGLCSLGLKGLDRYWYQHAFPPMRFGIRANMEKYGIYSLKVLGDGVTNGMSGFPSWRILSNLPGIQRDGRRRRVKLLQTSSLPLWKILKKQIKLNFGWTLVFFARWCEIVYLKRRFAWFVDLGPVDLGVDWDKQISFQHEEWMNWHTSVTAAGYGSKHV